ncbi:hypothetical protein [Bacillus mobilis]|uniref:hypothetical protein n=1 Tax=Bacillus mobilis TaxID=2026190 RepID=UPI003724021F
MAFFCMSISVSDELQLFAREIQNFLSPNFLRDLARFVFISEYLETFQVCKTNER